MQSSPGVLAVCSFLLLPWVCGDAIKLALALMQITSPNYQLCIRENGDRPAPQNNGTGNPFPKKSLEVVDIVGSRLVLYICAGSWFVAVSECKYLEELMLF
ncbi:unnamed protein product [Ranitomeya imitator]|uniref:Secreted protein n=1 Tax=Ranitomeya imitator TaxID=111125 RepID=A0ABN9M720_9NEOB|nr:unnamed protein product [Ranitomeya imitator]